MKAKTKSDITFKRGVVIFFAVAVIVFCAVFPCVMLLGRGLPPGEFAFDEYVGTLDNPGMGYTRTCGINAAPNNTKPQNVKGNIVLFFIDIGEFSSGANDSGIDYDFDDTFFAALDRTFENCRNNGSVFALRFRYDSNGVANPEPSAFDFVLRHIKQIKDSRVLEKYKDILMFVESGFVGKWGEQHSGKYTTTEYKARLLRALLDCVPSPVPVTVRTPDIFAQYVGIERSALADYECKNDDERRVGLYNDGYMGSDSDLGTYVNRQVETTWIGRQTLTSYFGGEYSGNIDFAKKYDTYKPRNCLPEMYKTHLGYINGNIFKLYKDMTFDKKYDVKGYDNSAYYGKSVFDFIRDHLGYRFVLEKSKLSVNVKRGGSLDGCFTLINNGFANPVKKFKSELLLEKDGAVRSFDVESDPTQWYSGKRVKETFKIRLPEDLASGKWSVYIKYSLGNTEKEHYAFRSVRFANIGVWNEELGANRIGSFAVQ